MPEIDVAQFKKSLTPAKARRREFSKLRAEFPELAQRATHRRVIGKLLKSFVAKAGLDVDKLDKMLAQNQSGLRRIFQEQKAAAAKFLSSETRTFPQAVDVGLRALEHLASRPSSAYLSTPVPLTTPFLIWEWPHAYPDEFLGSNYAPGNSYAKILIDRAVAFSVDKPSGSDEREFSFYFYWQNPSDYLAVANCASTLVLNGACEVTAATGVFSGSTNSLSLDAWLYPVQYWNQIDPTTGKVRSITDLRVWGDPLQHQSLPGLSATGGTGFLGLGAKAGDEAEIFPATSYDLRFGSFGGISIPARATAVFEVALKIGYSFSNGLNLEDLVKADFADDNLHYYVGCPMVLLELLTAPSTVNVAVAS